MPIQVDQSGKIEDTATDTVLAYANGRTFSILIPAREKRRCLHFLREYSKTGESIYRLLFATALYFLLKDIIEHCDLVLLDTEYQGHDAGIKEHILNLLRRANYSVYSHQVAFTYVGKKSPAHLVAYAVHRGNRRPDKIVTAEDLLGEFSLNK
jgi:hypothetical protein